MSKHEWVNPLYGRHSNSERKSSKVEQTLTSYTKELGALAFFTCCDAAWPVVFGYSIWRNCSLSLFQCSSQTAQSHPHACRDQEFKCLFKMKQYPSVCVSYTRQTHGLTWEPWEGESFQIWLGSFLVREEHSGFGIFCALKVFFEFIPTVEVTFVSKWYPVRTNWGY